MQNMLYSRNEYYGLIIDFWIKHCAQAQFIYCINIFYSKIFQSVNKKNGLDKLLFCNWLMACLSYSSFEHFKEDYIYFFKYCVKVI